MIKTKTLTTSIKIEFNDLFSILLTLSKEDWKPAIFESEKFFLRLAGVENKLEHHTLRRIDTFYRLPPMIGDIFFRDADVYYIAVEIYEIDPRIRSVSEDEPRLEIGIVSSRADGINERIRLFADAVTQAAREALGNRKTRHINFEWHEQTLGTPHIDRIINKDDSRTSFARPSLTSETILAASVLSEKPNRDLLIELSQAGFTREQDLLVRRKTQDQTRDILQILKSSGLIRTDFLLECKRSKTPLTRLHERTQLDEPTIAGLICPTCGAHFGDEAITESYSVSELGKRMAKKSHWMTVWITDLLTKLGISEDAILWNISENGEEIDLLVEFLGQLWIFELKDREFGSGDAYPLNYRQVRYKASKAIICTTEKVSKDAKRVFEELERESIRRPTRRINHGLVYIEGLHNAEEVLEREIAIASLGYANRKLAMLGQYSGYNLGTVLSKRFGALIDPQDIEDDREDETLF